MEMPRVLLCTRDAGLHDALATALHARRYRVAGTRPELVASRLAHESIDAVALEWSMPGTDGLEALFALRRHPGIGVVVLSRLASAEDRTMAIELGADDCMEVPLHPREFVARITAMLRRRGVAAGESRNATRYRFEGWLYDAARFELRTPEGMCVELAPGERRLLETFLEQPNRVLSRDRLLDATRPGRGDLVDRSIDMQVWRLRRTLQHAGASPDLLRTERGAGYILACDVERSAHQTRMNRPPS